MMSNEVLSEEECKKLRECYPPIDLKRMLLALGGVAVVFVIAAFVL